MTEPPRPVGEVRAVLAGYPVAAREQALALRALVYDVARAHADVGALAETLKWGEPAYLTEQSGSGTTLRIAWRAKHPDSLGLYVHCQTDLVARFRALTEGLAFEGKRGILLPLAEPLPEGPLRDCIAATLRYHLRG